MTQKEDIKQWFDELIQKRQYWKDLNKYYYKFQKKYFRFLISSGQSVLELGCETGDILNALEPDRRMGVEFSQEMVRIAKKRNPDLEFHTSDIRIWIVFSLKLVFGFRKLWIPSVSNVEKKGGASPSFF